MTRVDTGDTTTVDSAREVARQGNGQFGEQICPEGSMVAPRMENPVEKDGSWYFPPQLRSTQDMIEFWSEVPIPDEVLVRFVSAYKSRLAELSPQDAALRSASLYRDQVRTIVRAAMLEAMTQNWPEEDGRSAVLDHHVRLGSENLTVGSISERFYTHELENSLGWVDPAEQEAVRRAEERAFREQDLAVQMQSLEQQRQLLEAQLRAIELLDQTRRGVARSANIQLSEVTGRSEYLRPDAIEELPVHERKPVKKGFFG